MQKIYELYGQYQNIEAIAFIALACSPGIIFYNIGYKQKPKENKNRRMEENMIYRVS